MWHGGWITKNDASKVIVHDDDDDEAGWWGRRSLVAVETTGSCHGRSCAWVVCGHSAFVVLESYSLLYNLQ